MADFAPVALFAYKRPDHFSRTIEALTRKELAGETPLIVYVDGPKTLDELPRVEAVRRLAHQVTGFRSVEIVERPANLGLARSIIEGVTEVCRAAGQIIVLEDDLVTSPYFLRYMNEALALYRDEEAVISIHGYCYPVRTQLPETFFLRGADCWGWATWQRGWELFNPDGAALLAELQRAGLSEEFDFNGAYPFTRMLEQQIDGANDSWAIRWYASAFLARKLTLYPGQSLVRNIGTDGSGTHGGSTGQYDGIVSNRHIHLEKLPCAERPEVRAKIIHHLRGTKSEAGPAARLAKFFRLPKR